MLGGSALAWLLHSCLTVPAINPPLLCPPGRVVLLGDSAHAMQPNLGQGGCMAIEDAYQLVLDLCHVSRGGCGGGAVPREEGRAAPVLPGAVLVGRLGGRVGSCGLLLALPAWGLTPEVTASHCKLLTCRRRTRPPRRDRVLR